MADDLDEIRANIIRLPDQELLRLVTIDRQDYRPEAVAFATEEVRRRSLVVPPIVTVAQQVTASIIPPTPLHLTSSLPPIWPGYLFALALLVAETVEVIQDPEAYKRVTLVPVLIALGGWLYWLWCMRGISKVIHEASGDPRLRVPSRMRSFFMLHGLTWVIRWPGEVVDFVNGRLAPTTIDKRWPALGLLSGLLLSRVDAAVGLATVFGIGSYLRRRIVAALGLG